MSKRISLSYCYNELLNIEDSLYCYIATLSENFEYPHKRMEKTYSAAAEKVQETI